MLITRHVIERFQERITFECAEVVRSFIELDIQNSIHLYKINDIEKRLKDDIIYVIDLKNPMLPKVVTLYLQNEGAKIC
jgi:hypothetical protein